MPARKLRTIKKGEIWSPKIHLDRRQGQLGKIIHPAKGKEKISPRFAVNAEELGKMGFPWPEISGERKGKHKYAFFDRRKGALGKWNKILKNRKNNERKKRKSVKDKNRKI